MIWVDNGWWRVMRARLELVLAFVLSTCWCKLQCKLLLQLQISFEVTSFSIWCSIIAPLKSSFCGFTILKSWFGFSWVYLISAKHLLIFLSVECYYYYGLFDLTIEHPLAALWRKMNQSSNSYKLWEFGMQEVDIIEFLLIDAPTLENCLR